MLPAPRLQVAGSGAGLVSAADRDIPPDDLRTSAAMGGAAGSTAWLPEALDETHSLPHSLAVARHRIAVVSNQEATLPGNAGARYFAQNPGQQLVARFFDDRVRISSGVAATAPWYLTLGREAGKVPPTVVGSGNRVEYHHADGVVEWFANVPEGIEHCYHLAQRPAEAADGQVELRVRIDGLAARQAAPDLIELAGPDGKAVLGYTKLKVWDATGTALTAAMSATGDGEEIILAFNDTAARYPVTVDPFIFNFDGVLNAGVNDRNHYGESVEMDGNTAVIGCPRDDQPDGINAGSVYVFRRDPESGEWASEGQITRNSGGILIDGYELGFSVAIRGDLLVAGAPGADKRDPFGLILESNRGEALVARRTAGVWAVETALLASDGRGSVSGDPTTDADIFGFSVGVDGGVIAVGARREDPDDLATNGSQTGAVYIFVADEFGWNEVQKLSGPGSISNFGYALAVSGNSIAVGAPNTDVSLIEEDGQRGANGMLQVFERSGPAEWTVQQTLTEPVPGVMNLFGHAISLDGDNLLVGAPGVGFFIDYAFMNDRAYVYTRSAGTWAVQATLSAQGRSSPGNFGRAVAIHGDIAIVGSPLENYRTSTLKEFGTDDGAAYVFERIANSWTQVARFAPGSSELPPGTEFGTAVAVSSGVLLVGAPDSFTSPETATNPGQVLVYSAQSTLFRVRDSTLSGAAGAGIEGATVEVLVGDQIRDLATTGADGAFAVDESAVTLTELHDIRVSKEGAVRVYQAVRLSDPAQRSFTLPLLLRTRLDEELAKLEATAPVVLAYNTVSARAVLQDWNSPQPETAAIHQQRDRALARLLLASKGMVSVFADSHLVSIDAAKLTVGTYMSLTAYRKILTDALRKLQRKTELLKRAQGAVIERAANLALAFVIRTSGMGVAEVQKGISTVLQQTLPPWAAQLLDQAITVVVKTTFAALNEANNNGSPNWNVTSERAGAAGRAALLQGLAEALIAEVGGRLFSSAYVLETNPNLNLAAARTRNRDFLGSFLEAANASTGVVIESHKETLVALDASKTVSDVTKQVAFWADVSMILSKAPGAQIAATMSIALRTFNNVILLGATINDYDLLLDNAFDRAPLVAELAFRPASPAGGNPAPRAPRAPRAPGDPVTFDATPYLTLLGSIRTRLLEEDAAGLLDDGELLEAADKSLQEAIDLALSRLAARAPAASPRNAVLNELLLVTASHAGKTLADRMSLFAGLAGKFLPEIADPDLTDADMIALIDRISDGLSVLQGDVAQGSSESAALVAPGKMVFLSYGLPAASELLGVHPGPATIQATVANSGDGVLENVTLTFEPAAPVAGELAALGLVSPPVATIGSLEPGATATVSWNIVLTDTSPLAAGSAAVYTLASASSAGPGPHATGIVEIQPTGQSYAQWLAEYPVTPAGGFHDDPDSDALANGLERFLGSDPAGSDRGLFGLTPGGTGLPILRHSRSGRQGTDTAPRYEWSLDLAAWHPAGGSAGDLTVNLRPRVIAGGGTGNQTVEVVPEAVGAANPQQLFLRLGVVPVPEPPTEPPPLAPQITGQPEGGTFAIESQVTLRVVAIGTGPLLHQWFRNGEPLDGEVGATLVIPSFDFGNRGSYTVRILGPGGTVTSSAATLEIEGGGGV